MPITVSSGRVGGKKRIGKFFKRGVLCDRLDYYRDEESELATTIVEEYESMDFTLMDLIQELDKVMAFIVTADSDMTLKEKRYRMEILKIMVHNRLETADVFSYGVDVIDEFFELQQIEIDELGKLKYHRHKTVLGLYTEKQVY